MLRAGRIIKPILVLALVALAHLPMCSSSSTSPLSDTIDPGDGGQVTFETPEVRFYPQDGRGNVVTTTDIELFFSVDMDEYNDWKVAVFVKRPEDPDFVEHATYDRTTLSGVSWQRRALAILPADAFAQGIKVKIDVIGFASLQGVSMPDQSATFTIVQYAAPSVAITPVNDATNVIPAANVRLEFNLPVADSGWTVTVCRPGNNCSTYSSASPEKSWSGNVLTINPPGYFSRGDTVSVTTTGFKTAFGAMTVPDASSSFTIGTDMPSIAWGDTEPLAITAPLRLVFIDRDVNRDCGSGDPNCDWVVIPDKTQPGNYNNNSGEADIKWITIRELDVIHTGTYLQRGSPTASVGIFYDTDGYSFGNGVSPVEVVYDVKQNPGMTNYYPTTGATDVSINTNISLSFDEPVKEGCAWSVEIKKEEDGTIYAYSSSWNGSRTMLTLDPTDFPEGKIIRVTADGFKAADDKAFNSLTFTFTPSVIPVTGVTLDNSNLRIVKGRTASLTAIFTPAEPTNQTVKWNSTDNTVATVPPGASSVNVTVTAVEKGTAVITGTTDDGSYKASCRVMVVESFITFASDRDGKYDIYVMNADGTAQTSLMTNSSHESNPDWSPDGAKITFNSNRDGNYEIYVMDADGNNQTRLTFCDGHNSTEPRWSPDGTRIAFHSGCSSTDQVYVMNADGTGQTQLTSEGENGSAYWSPDNSKIAFNSNRNGNWEIYVMDADGENETRVTNNIVDDHNPAWSPDGSRIVYQSYVGGNWEIYVMDANGDNQVWLTNNSVDDQKPKWSPDGTQIVFQSYCDGYEQIYIMNSDGTQQNRITYPDAYLYNNNAASWLFKEPSDTPYFIVGGEPIMLNDPVPEGIACPMGVNDNGDIDGNGSQYIPSPVTIEYDYVVGETEVTYRQWKDVYNWATDPARGAERYYFANAGVQGCGASTTDLHPVTTINWRDAIVWCNALTEYCNKDNVAKLECAYHANAGFSSPHRSSVYEELLHAGDGEIDNPHVNASAGGFRLLTGDEWELAARFISPGVYYHGNFASGADDVYYVSPATSDYDGDGYFASSANVAVYAAVNGGGAGTAVVRSKRPNAMGLYDMGGNVWEWCFDPSPSSISGERLRIGGGFNHTSYHLQIGERYSGKGDPWNAAGDVGFRVTRTVVE